MKSISLLILCLLIFNCHGESPQGLTPEEEDLLVEATALLSLAAQEHSGNIDILTVRQDSIFSSLGTRREDYHQLVEKMSQRPERWLEVWERIAEGIEEYSGEKAKK